MFDEHKDSCDMYHNDYPCHECDIIKKYAYGQCSEMYETIHNIDEKLNNVVSYQNENIIYYVPLSLEKILHLNKDIIDGLRFVPDNYDNYKVTCCIRDSINDDAEWEIYHECKNFQIKKGIINIKRGYIIRLVIRRDL